MQVYDLRKKAKIQTLDKHVNAVSSLAFSPCGNYVRSPSSLRHLRFLLHIPSILLAWDRIDRVSPGVAWESGDDYVFRFISDSLSQGSMNDANSSPVLSFPHLLTPLPSSLPASASHPPSSSPTASSSTSCSSSSSYHHHHHHHHHHLLLLLFWLSFWLVSYMALVPAKPDLFFALCCVYIQLASAGRDQVVHVWNVKVRACAAQT